MYKLSKFVMIAAVLSPLVLGCGEDAGAYDPDWAAEETLEVGKADGLLDIAQALEFDQAVSGNVGGERIEVYTLALHENDKVKLQMTVTSGDLNPHISFFYGTAHYVSSDDWEREGNVLSKWYSAAANGKHLVAVRAYHAQGQGGYSLVAACLSGPCNGDPIPGPEEGYSIGEVNECLVDAQKCAFDNMGQYNGAVGEARARQLLQDCLDSQTLYGGITCARACEAEVAEDDWDTSAEQMCQDIREAIIFYADQDEDCLYHLNECLDVCYDVGDGSWWGDYEEMWHSPIAVCWETGFNGDCDGYARGHTDCGGDRYGPEDPGECYEMCESTSGAWTDDLDTICSDECDGYCEAALETCREECGDDEGCVSGCMDPHEDYCWW